MTKKTGLFRAVELFDNSPSKLAAATGGAFTRQNVEYWLTTGRVPGEFCPHIERATRAVAGGPVLCEELRPDVPWDVLRLQTETVGA